MAARRHPLSYYLALDYPYTVMPDEGSFVIEFPDLPGCMTQVEDASEIPEAADEIRALWIEGEYEDGHDIPEPARKEYSGKFVTRVPKSLHRDLAENARRESMSLNAYVNYLLAERNVTARLLRQIFDSEARTTPDVIQPPHRKSEVVKIVESQHGTGRLARSNFRLLRWKEAG